MSKSGKLKQLFAAARRAPAPSPPQGFEFAVLQAIRREKTARSLTLFEQLGRLFPRLALASAVFIVLCFAADMLLSQFGSPDLSAALDQLSDQWLFAVKGF
jgi:hypothetical protein